MNQVSASTVNGRYFASKYFTVTILILCDTAALIDFPVFTDSLHEVLVSLDLRFGGCFGHDILDPSASFCLI